MCLVACRLLMIEVWTIRRLVTVVKLNLVMLVEQLVVD
jgi:hypothetical protein